VEFGGFDRRSKDSGISVGRGRQRHRLTFHIVGGPGGGRLAVGPVTPPEFDASNFSTLRLPVVKFTSYQDGASPPAKLRCSRNASTMPTDTGQIILKY
jgi:hypothetical protein